VLLATLLVMLSMAFAPRRGLVWTKLRQRRHRRTIATQAVLEDLRALALQHDDAAHGHPAAVLVAMSGGRRDVHRTLRTLEARGLARRDAQDRWAITDEGRDAAAEGQPGSRPDAE
jgi:manganese/zinc/iron transport system permease protein